ncbi:MAG: ABC transporter permease [Balneolaceae bacterium]
MIKNLISEFFSDLYRQKLRSSLTLTAIGWGTLSVILLLAFGRGLGTSLVSGMLGAGNQVIIVYGGQTGMSHDGLPMGRPIRFTEADVEQIQRAIPGIEYSSPQYGRGGMQLEHAGNITTTFMEGVGPDFNVMRSMYATEGGRFINQRDIDQNRKVLFLGDEIAVTLFGEEDPIGGEVKLDGVPFTVIGVMEPKMQTSMNNGPDANRAIIPFSTFRNLYGNQNVGSILIRPADPSLQPQVKQKVTNYLASKYNFNPEDSEAIPMWDFIEDEKMTRSVATGLEYFLFTVGFFTLMIAGVGVANIMFVVVKERTREIGLKKAIGARKVHIISQFLFESIFISLLGGAAGLAISVGIVEFVLSLNMTEGAGEFLGSPQISTASVLITTGVLVLIGVVAGIFPAIKAARLDPVESLRYE